MPEAYKQQTNLKKLRDKHLALAREIVMGATHAEAAGRTGFSEGRVAILVNAPLFEAEVARLRAEIDNQFITEAANTGAATKEEVRQSIDNEVVQSLATLVELRDDDEVSGAVRQKSALEILNLAGYKTEEKVGTTMTVEVGEGLQAMLQAAIDRDKSGGECQTVGGDVVVNIEDENSQPEPRPDTQD